MLLTQRWIHIYKMIAASCVYLKLVDNELFDGSDVVGSLGQAILVVVDHFDCSM